MLATNNPICSFTDVSTFHCCLAFNKSVSLTDLNFNKHYAAATLSRALETITEWEVRYLVKFNTAKTMVLSVQQRANNLVPNINE